MKLCRQPEELDFSIGLGSQFFALNQIPRKQKSFTMPRLGTRISEEGIKCENAKCENDKV